MKRYKIEKDKYLNKWVVWELHRNYHVARKIGFKYQCEEWVNKHK